MKNSVGRFARFFICSIICLLVACFSAHAESSGSKEWEFQLSLYGWLDGQTGTVATLPGLPPTDIDVDFYDDILGNINFALFLVGEAHKGRWGGRLDIAYTDIEDENALPNAILWSSADSRTKSWMVSAAGLYRLVERPACICRCGRRHTVLEHRFGAVAARRIAAGPEYLQQGGLDRPHRRLERPVVSG